MSFLTQGKTNWKYILILLILAGIVSEWILSYLRYFEEKISFLTKFPEIKKLEKIGEDTVANWKTYTNKIALFRIKYPADWEVQEIYEENEELNISLSKTFKEKSGELKCEFNIAPVPLHFLDVMLENYPLYSVGGRTIVGRKVEEEINGIPTIKIISNVPTLTHYFLERELLERESSEKIKIYYHILPLITKYTPREEGGEYVDRYFFNEKCMQTFNQMLSTFEFLESPEIPHYLKEISEAPIFYLCPSAVGVWECRGDFGTPPFIDKKITPEETALRAIEWERGDTADMENPYFTTEYKEKLKETGFVINCRESSGYRFHKAKIIDNKAYVIITFKGGLTKSYWHWKVELVLVNDRWKVNGIKILD